ncbi:beta-1,4-galactosyltransferase 4-like [Carassius auratus]|uniref:Beta-1,4-galactosyltransferase n=1 Tax=Carassius auratus TaxID=7957 RepID=A0A6P6NRM4_CARAU|nr:beta-1,4-galactosyltransferase 4-like [Carassius auratus]XP_026111151.1 beta-1,4-galactosyltransferase 4-like [Carassius auratus]XP_026111157.1 beta-1,4-galactosyltransferase 4-like [Carassius auratus]
MGLFPSISKIIRKGKGKCLFLLLLCLCVVAWIATFSNDDTVKSVQKGLSPDERTVKGLPPLELESEMIRSIEEQSVRESCPEQSPLLRGSIKLSFDPSLTSGQVESENGEVVEGQYNPSDCVARQKVAILIPHRNREKHLLYLLHHLHPFLQRQQLHYAIYIIHQAGEATFNRAKLLNVGYLEALKDQNWDCFIFHDVDLVPENDHNLYMCEDQPKHLVVGRNSTGYKLRYKGYFGGVSAMTKEQFHKVNGFPNSYWGWGGEDDDLRIRVTLQKMSIIRPSLEVARYTMVFHKRDSGNQINKERMHLLRRTHQTWKTDGLNSCSYKILSVHRAPLFINITTDIGRPESAH